MDCKKDIIHQLVLNASIHYQLPVEKITGYCKVPLACIAREMVWMIVRSNMAVTHPVLSDIFSGRDTSGISKGVRRISNEFKVNKELKTDLEAIMSGIEIPANLKV